MSACSHFRTWGEVEGLCRVTSILRDVLSQRRALQASMRFVAVHARLPASMQSPTIASSLLVRVVAQCVVNAIPSRSLIKPT